MANSKMVNSMRLYIQPQIQVVPVETKDFLCQDVASPSPTGPIVSGGEVVSGGGTGFNPGGGL